MPANGHRVPEQWAQSARASRIRSLNRLLQLTTTTTSEGSLVKHGVRRSRRRPPVSSWTGMPNISQMLETGSYWRRSGSASTTKPAAIKQECNGIHVHRLTGARIRTPPYCWVDLLIRKNTSLPSYILLYTEEKGNRSYLGQQYHKFETN